VQSECHVDSEQNEVVIFFICGVGGGLFSRTEIQTWTAGMTVWRDDHYSIGTHIGMIIKIMDIVDSSDDQT